MSEIALETAEEFAIQSSFLQSLQESIDEQEIIELGLDKIDDTYSIKDMDHANYVAKNLHTIREKMEVVNQTASNSIESHKNKVEKWQVGELTPLLSAEARLVGLLQEFAKRQLEGSSKKSIKLVEGTLGFRKQPDKFDYDDEVLLAFLQVDLPDYVKQKPQINKVDLKKAGEAKEGQFFVAGKVIPGIVVTPQNDSFEVK